MLRVGLGYGTSSGLKAAREFHRICKVKYGKYYILKCDISKFFASINTDRLKEKLKRKIKDKEALKIVFDIIDSEPDRTWNWEYDVSGFCNFLSKRYGPLY